MRRSASAQRGAARWAIHPPELDLAINTGSRKGSQYELTWDMVN
jgi:hypothetical protein